MTEQSNDEMRKASALYIGGKSVIEVAKAMDITYGRARRLIALNGTPLRDASKRLVGRTRPVRL